LIFRSGIGDRQPEQCRDEHPSEDFGLVMAAAVTVPAVWFEQVRPSRPWPRRRQSKVRDSVVKVFATMR
jgi:hypothetical protein